MAWTGNFKTQIEDLAGTLEVVDDNATQQWILDGCYDVLKKAVDKYGAEETWKFAVESSDETANDIDVDEIRTIAGVFRNGVHANRGAWHLKAKYADANSIYAATENDPVWYLDDSKLSIYPAPDGSNPANYYYIPEYAITNWDTSTSVIANYPSEYYYYAALYAAIRVLHRKMLDKHESLVDLNVAATPPDIPDAPVIASPGVATLGLPDVSGEAPQYNGGAVFNFASDLFTALATKTISSLDIEGTIGSLSSCPSIATVSYSAPSTTTVADVNDMLVEDIVTISDSAVTSASDAGSNQPGFTQPSIPSFPNLSDRIDELNNFIDDEEDTELASAKAQEISIRLQDFTTELQKYQAEIQSNTQEFNEDNTIYQALIQQGLQNAQAINQAAIQNMQKDLQIAQANLQKSQAESSTNHATEAQQAQTNANLAQTKLLQDAVQATQAIIADNNAIIQKYQQDLSEYQAELGREVQEYQVNLDKEMQIWQNTQSQVLQQHSQKMQDALNLFNKENTRYQAEVQAVLQKAQVDAQELSKEADLSMQADIQDATLRLQKYQQDLAAYQADVNKEVQEYQANIQKDQMDYDWIEKQYTSLKQEYYMEFSIPQEVEAE